MKPKTIAQHLGDFHKTKNPLHLIRAIILVIRQGRIDEVIFGLYNLCFHKPSEVIRQNHEAPSEEEISNMIQEADRLFWETQLYTREQLIECFGDKFNVKDLPHKFTACRNTNIVQINDLLIVGEYAYTPPSATVAVITKDSCRVIDFYNELPGVLHIHSIHLFNESELLISTGDTKKLTDLWTIEGNNITFKKRIRRYLAGYTAAIKINNQHFFGTDFSRFPNYIETLEGERYFFPSKAYKMYTYTFHGFSDRYLVARNNELASFGGRQAMTIFDTVKRQFIFCEYWSWKDGIASRPNHQQLIDEDI